jgi:CheY-like chemotaxis protein
MDDSTIRTTIPPSESTLGGDQSWPGEDLATVLVVEDDEPIRLALGELLELEGYDVLLAADGHEALEILAREVPALVVTDMQMPRVDGVQLCRELRSADGTRDVPIVVLTAAHDLATVRRWADAIVRKPFDFDVLTSIIAQFIRPTLPPRTSSLTASGRFRPVATPISRLELFVTSGSTTCERAERALRAVLRQRAASGVGAPAVEVIDIAVESDRARRAGVAMTPTLVHELGERRHLCVGDLSDENVLRDFLGDVRT